MRVLIAEDESISRRILESQLGKWGYEVVSARSGAEAWEILQAKGSPSLAILDWQMPEMDGVEVCRRVRQLAKEPYAYLILLTSRSRSEDVVVGLEAGADDYVAKPFDPSELRVRLRAGRRILELCEQLVAARESLTERAMRDSLTGLLNRGAVLEALGRELGRAKRNSAPVGVILADLDHFKRINDTFGHLAGDAVLREATRRMHASRRVYDYIGRYGGEEFLVVVPGCNLELAARVAERMRTAIGADEVDTAEGRISLTISLGVSAFEPAIGADADTLIRAADRALYRAKDLGRNRVESLAVAGVSAGQDRACPA
jgi:diguanylate cyclase (GGDEF)-like protein